MIKINRKNLEPIVVKDAHTVDEAVEYAVRNHISLEGAELSATDLSWTDLSGANLSGADLSGADLSYAYLPQANLAYADLTDADLFRANLRGVDLSGADLRRANLRGIDLSGANIDFSGLPLCCGSLNVKIDKRIFCQLLYHVLRAGESVDDEEVKKLFSIPEVVELANQFHRVEECGKLRNTKEE